MKRREKAAADFKALRHDAEKLLKNRTLSTDSQLSDIDTLKLIHELEVHQIELEMQNEELLQTRTYAAELANEKYAELYDFVPSGFFTLSNEGKIIGLNICGSKMLCKERSLLINSFFGIFISDDTRPVFNLFLRKVFNSQSSETCEVTLSANSEFPMYVLLNGISTPIEEQCLVTMTDITDNKLVEMYGEMSSKILQILNEPGDLKDSLHLILKILKKKTGFNAVGIRLQEGDDFPYFDQKGFSDSFLLTENKLLEYTEDGKVCRDKNGCVSLACTCGLVISGKADPANPFFTPGGSWWTNDSFPLLDIPADQDDRFHPRNQCIHQGYASVAIVPIRSRDRIVGLIQFNDKRKECFTRQIVEFFEGIASHIGEALMRKQAEELLKENNSRLELSMQVANMAWWEMDVTTGIVVFEKRKAEMLGYPSGKFNHYTDFVALIHPEDSDRAMNAMRDLFDGILDKYEVEYRILTKSGEYKWFYVIGSVVKRDSTGRPLIITGIIIDITERKRIGENLRLSEERYKSLFQGNYSVMMIINPETGEIKDANPAACRYYGWTHTEMCSKNILDISILPSQDVIELMQKAKDEECNHFFSEHCLANGKIRNVEIYSGPINFKESIFLYSLIHDVTARKQAESELIHLNEELEDRVKERTAELLTTNATLRETKEKYRTVADFAFNWEFWTDQNDLMVYCSPSCERITGYKATEFVQNSRLLLDIIHPCDLNTYLNHKQNEEMVQDESVEFQYRIIRHDGTLRWIGHICQPIFDESGIFIGSRGSNKDITERKYTEQLLKISNHKYELLSENITDGIFICRDGYFEYVNKAFNFIFGYDDHELEMVKLTQLALPDYQDELEKFLSLNGLSNKNRNIEIECKKKDHSIIFIEILLNYVASEKAIYGVVHDITEKKQLQKSIIKAIIHTEEKERTHFSKELHDGLGPLLSTIKLYLQWSERPKTNKSREEIIHKAEDILEEALTTVKEISYKLSPHLLTYYGLTSAIRSFIDKLEESSAIEITFESNSDRRFELEMETAIYRAIIECINNTVKHAMASKISIRLNDTGRQIHLQYRDNGIGYDLKETLSAQRGLGLFNLQNRIQSIGGKIILSTRAGYGVDYQIIISDMN